ncbi:hypothetical protein ACH5RR_013254 [Cinchona calisaya]|uniref:Uncharacterized protein n=1 Tax=Cinchona calisaya TaxID=153742 RepID=A0ABD3A352_9GENT
MSIKVASCIQDGKWKWPVGRKLTAEVKQLQQATPDSFKPLPGKEDQTIWLGKRSNEFSVKTAMKALRDQSTTVDRWHLEWDKVLKLCCTTRRNDSFIGKLEWMSKNWKVESFGNQLKKLALAATIYHLNARNGILFHHIPTTPITIVADIMNAIQYTACKERKVTLFSIQTPGSTTPFVDDIYDQLKETLKEYDIIISHWPEHTIQLERAMTDVEKAIVETMEKQ